MQIFMFLNSTIQNKNAFYPGFSLTLHGAASCINWSILHGLIFDQKKLEKSLQQKSLSNNLSCRPLELKKLKGNIFF